MTTITSPMDLPFELLGRASDLAEAMRDHHCAASAVDLAAAFAGAPTLPDLFEEVATLAASIRATVIIPEQLIDATEMLADAVEWYEREGNDASYTLAQLGEKIEELYV